MLANKILASVLAGAVLSMMVFMGWLVWNYHKTRPPIPLGQDNFQRLAKENPNLLRPYVLVHRARESVSNFNESLHSRQDLIKQMQFIDGSNVLDDKSVEYAQKLTPRQRAQILRELSQIINDGKGDDDYVTTTPGQRHEILKDIDNMHNNGGNNRRK